MAPTTMAPTTPAPTTMAPTTPAPTVPPTLISLVSIEKNELKNTVLNLAEVKIYDENGAMIPKSRLSALLSPFIDNANSFPASNLIDEDRNNFAHTNNITYKFTGGSVDSPNPRNVEFVAYVPAINDWVFMIVDGGWLKMVNMKNTVAKYVTSEGKSDPSQIFNVNNWNSYNVSSVSPDGRQPGYRVISEVPTVAPFSPQTNSYTGVQFMQIKISPPSRVSKIEIFNRTDCCQERIDNTIVKTLNPSNMVVSSGVLKGSSMKHTISYNSTNGVISSYLASA